MKAQINLERQGFETYYPRFQKQRKHARRLDTIMAPLFPRYIFVKFDLEMDRWHAIHSTIGVKQLVSFGDKPGTVSQDIINDIRANENERGYINVYKQSPFKKGDAVKMLNGPFSNIVGWIEKASDDDRVTILLGLLGRKVRTKVPACFLEAYS